ncbi:hypothetical protein ACFL5V_12170, partial [Fibrobacterota bacterium]
VVLEGILDCEAERNKMKKELAKTAGFIKSLTAKLSNVKFLKNAPENVIERERQKLETQRETARKLETTIAELS